MAVARTKAEKEELKAVKHELERPIVVCAATEDIPDGETVPANALAAASKLRGLGATVRITYACAVYPPSGRRKRPKTLKTFCVRWRTERTRGYALWPEAAPGAHRAGLWRRGAALPENLGLDALDALLSAEEV